MRVHYFEFFKNSSRYSFTVIGKQMPVKEEELKKKKR